MAPMPTAQAATLAILPKISGLLSCFGSGWIIADCRKRAKVYHRLLLGMSISDFCSAFFWFLSSWCIPRGAFWGAVGNKDSCILQGFFLQLHTTTAVYNASLALFFLLVIRHGWSEHRIRTTVEPWLHGGALSIGIGCAIAGLPLTLYNQVQYVCWIAAYPIYCNQSYKNEDPTDCVRGDNAYLYMYPLFFFWQWVSILLASLCMIFTYTSIRNVESAMGRYGHRSSSSIPQRPDLTRPVTRRTLSSLRSDSNLGTQEVMRKKSRRFANQGLLYLAAFYLTYFFPLVAMTFRHVNHSSIPFPFPCTVAFFVPLQGFCNFLVYIRPRYLSYRKKTPELSAAQAIWHLLHSPCRKVFQDGNEGDGGRKRASPPPLTLAPRTPIHEAEAVSVGDMEGGELQESLNAFPDEMDDDLMNDLGLSGHREDEGE